MKNMRNMATALSEIFYRNPQRHDGHAYVLGLVAWGLGIKTDRPDPADFGQHAVDDDDIQDFVQRMKTLYEEIENEEQEL